MDSYWDGKEVTQSNEDTSPWTMYTSTKGCSTWLEQDNFINSSRDVWASCPPKKTVEDWICTCWLYVIFCAFNITFYFKVSINLALTRQINILYSLKSIRVVNSTILIVQCCLLLNVLFPVIVYDNNLICKRSKWLLLLLYYTRWCFFDKNSQQIKYLHYLKFYYI